jgi:hypothetical protein
MTRFTTILNAMMLCAAPVAMAQAGADGPLTLSSGQMDRITAGEVTAPLAAAAAVANATGQFTFYKTSTNAYAAASAPGPLSGNPGTYTTVSDAMSLAVATGPGAQISAGTAILNQQPLPPEAVQSTIIQYTGVFPGAILSIQSEVDVGGYNIYLAKQALARSGGF